MKISDFIMAICRARKVCVTTKKGNETRVRVGEIVGVRATDSKPYLYLQLAPTCIDRIFISDIQKVEPR